VTQDAPLDLSPRDDGGATPVAARRRRSWAAIAVVVALVAGIGFVLYKGLSDATVFFYNVDEAAAKRSEIGTKRVRLQGNVVDGTIRCVDSGLTFTLQFAGARVEVAHSGDQAALFGTAIPVVLEGQFASRDANAVFDSDQMFIKHDASYDEKNADRQATAQRDADAAAAGAGASAGAVSTQAEVSPPPTPQCAP